MSTFVNVPFPDNLAFGSQMSVTWSTDITRSIGGSETSNQNWQDDLIEVDASFAVQTKSDYEDLRNHFHQVRGRAKTFPFKNHLDYECTSANGAVLTTALVAPAGNGTFYLHKSYGSGADVYYKRITRPDSPIKVYRVRSAVASDITGAGAAVTYTTGAVAITGHAGGDTYYWTGTFKLVCRYDTDKLPGVVIDREPNGELFVRCESIPIVERRE